MWNNAVNGIRITEWFFNNKPIVDISGALYHAIAVDAEGGAWFVANSNINATRITTDTLGNPFLNNIQPQALFNTNFTLKSDGSVWTWGNDDLNFYAGSAKITKPIKLPSSVKYKKISVGAFGLLALSDNGDVYEYRKGRLNPVKVSSFKCSDISAGYLNHIILDENGWPFGWGNGAYMGYAKGNPTSPVPLKDVWGIVTPIKKLTINHNTVHFIDISGDMYGLGDNAMGEVGNGEELVNHAEVFPTPYSWGWLKKGLMISKPVKIGSNFTDLFTGSTYAFFHFAISGNGDLYSWGRNKTLALGNGKAITPEDVYPNALDILSPTKVTPMTVNVTQLYGFKPYTLNAGNDQSIVLPNNSVNLNGVGLPSSGYTIKSYQWQKISGPGSFTIVNPNAASTVLNNLMEGEYIFRLTMTDNNTATISDDIKITVSKGSR